MKLKAVIEVTEIMILSIGNGPDRLLMKTTLPMGLYPYRGNSVITLEVAADKGVEYVEKNFPGMQYDHVKVGRK
jgi:hypothetical protein